MRIFASFSSGVNAIATGTFIDMCAIKPKTTTQLEIFHNEENKNRLRSFKGLVYARENQEVACGKLSIRCRRKARDHDVFLIASGYQVVAHEQI